MKAANDRLQDPNALLLTWGFHQYFHGQLRKADLDAISSTRPIIVWHRSAHEVYLNSADERKYGITREWFDSLPASPRKQTDFANAHYWEQGLFAVLPKLGAAIASPERIQAGLKFVRDYYHANGVTLGSEPGGLMSKPLQDAQNAVLGDSSSPFRFYFIADGKSITAKFPDAQVGAETAKLLGWGQGMTAFLPRQVKLFADGAIFSQAMQLSQTYSDGHKGEWMMDPEFFARSFRVYWDLGYQVHDHDPCHQSAESGSGTDQGHSGLGNGSRRQSVAGASSSRQQRYLEAGARSGSADAGVSEPGRCCGARTRTRTRTRRCMHAGSIVGQGCRWKPHQSALASILVKQVG